MFIKKKIHEYDIRSCDISVLADVGFFDEKQYNYYKSLPKSNRVIQIGIMRGKDKKMGKILKESIENAVSKFNKANDISEEEIYEVVKDAVWIHRRVKNTDFGKYVKFVCKNTASSIFIFKGMKFYYDSNTGVFFTRGIGKAKPKILELIQDVMSIAECGDSKKLYKVIHEAKLKYVRKELDESYYINTAFKNEELLDALIEDFI